MIFTDELPLSEPMEAALRAVPAKWGVCLLADEAGRPVQLLMGKDLRGLVRRRMLAREEDGPTKRADLRAVVRRLRWRRVYSDFEADAVYYEAARAFFPESYRKLVTFRPAWFVEVDPSAEHPRWRAFAAGTRGRGRMAGEVAKALTPALSQGEREPEEAIPRDSEDVLLGARSVSDGSSGSLTFGPIEDQRSANRLIELLEDVFDLCRYHHILVQAPQGQACAYKEMGRCPAPCDGSIPMEEYRAMIARSAAVLDDPRAEIDEQNRRMQAAAEALEFERAGRIKGRIEQLSQLGRGGLRHLRRLEELAFVSVQPGPRAGTGKVFVVTPGRIAEVCGLMGAPDRGEALRLVEEACRAAVADGAGAEGAETIAITAHHLFSRKAEGDGGVVVPVGEFWGARLDAVPAGASGGAG